MSSRTAKFVTAMFASVLAGIALTTASHGAVSPAESCLSGPKGAPPKGGHWYYRIDRATKRHCWYVGDAKEKPSRITAQDPSASQEQRQSIADARAELPMPQTQVEQDAGVTAAPANAANIVSGARAGAELASPQRSIIALRWPESPGTNASADPGPATGHSGANVPSNSAALPPTLAAVTLAAADSSTEKPSAAVQMLLVVVIGALSLAGLMGSAIYRFGGTMRWNGRPEIRPRRRAIWDLADGDRRSPAVYAADDPRRRIAAMIARLSRTSAA